mgnify:CR=1 FL=1
MMTLDSIRRLFAEAFATGDHITFLAAKVAYWNYQRYGMMTPEDVANQKRAWGIE